MNPKVDYTTDFLTIHLPAMNAANEVAKTSQIVRIEPTERQEKIIVGSIAFLLGWALVLFILFLSEVFDTCGFWDIFTRLWIVLPLIVGLSACLYYLFF